MKFKLQNDEKDVSSTGRVKIELVILSCIVMYTCFLTNLTT